MQPLYACLPATSGTQGIPESALIGLVPDKYVQPPSPFRTIAELAASLPWLLRVHQSMQWVQQMPNGLMTVQRLVCPAASEMGGLAAPDGVLAIDWQCIEQVGCASQGPNIALGRAAPPPFAGDGSASRGAPPRVSARHARRSAFSARASRGSRWWERG